MKQQIIYGLQPVIETIESGSVIEKVYIKKGLSGDNAAKLMKLMNRYEIPFQFAPVERLNQMSRKNHQGVIAVASLIEFYQIEQIIPGLFETGKNPFVLLLDEITDVRNFGAISRTAECAGIDAIIIPAKGSAQVNEDAIKTSAGALQYIKVCRVNSLLKAIKYLKESGLQIVSATEKAGKAYYDIDYSCPVAVVLGSEDKGISPSILNLSDESVKIPMAGKIASLNVSNAASVIIFEALRQRRPI